MEYAASNALPDIQKTKDRRGVAIDKAGVCDLSLPITVLGREHHKQQTLATNSISVRLPHHFKGTHMSRLLELLCCHQGEVTMRTLPAVLHDFKRRLDSKSARIEVDFAYFFKRKAPVSGAEAPMDYQCTFIGESNGKSDDFLIRVKVPVATFCPCSKEISDYGTHNQRGTITLTVRPKKKNGLWELIWIEELVAYAEQSGSAPLFPLLKRPDERHVTMLAYDNPVFVEDVARNAGRFLKKDKRISWFEIRAVNHESIHNHSAFAVVQSGGSKP